MKRTRGVSPEADDIHLRRERGRKAQQAFRQRQITAINDLRASNEAMQTAIASLSRVASKLGNAELDEAMRVASRAAGLDDQASASESHDTSSDKGKAPADVPNEPQTDSTTCAPSPSPVADPSFAVPAGPQITLSLIDTQAPSPSVPPVLTHSPMALSYASPAYFHDEMPPGGPLPAYETGRMSPRLGYGLWMERATPRLRDPPMDIAPYLDIDTTSLSSVVYWTGMLWASRLLEVALGGNVEAMAFCNDIFSEIRSMGTLEMISHNIRAKLSFRRWGYVEADHPGYEMDGGARVHNIMMRESAAKGRQLETLLRPAAVEQLFRRRLGADYAVIELGLKCMGPPEDVSRVRALVEVMTKTGRCIGDGPRWSSDRMAAILESWVAWDESPRP
ncbi:hypothetical protein ACHAQH_008867 [Verticillium albo-atrum]